jgi:hypothetical protein
MEERVPSFSTEPVADSDKPNSILEAFLEYFGMNFWELVAEQTNLKSVQGTLHSLKTTAAEILHLSRTALVMGTLKLPQAELYWSRLLQLPLICDSMPTDRYFKLRNNLHLVNKLGDHDPDDKLWKIRPLIDAVKKEVCYFAT